MGKSVRMGPPKCSLAHTIDFDPLDAHRSDIPKHLAYSYSLVSFKINHMAIFVHIIQGIHDA